MFSNRYVVFECTDNNFILCDCNYNFSVNLDDNNHIQDKVVTGIKPLALSALTDNRGVLIFSGSEERRDIKVKKFIPIYQFQAISEIKAVDMFIQGHEQYCKLTGSMVK